MKKTVTQLLAATGLVLSMSASAQAAAILVTTPLSVSFNAGGSTPWDIDGNGTPEFTFVTSLNDVGSGFDRIFSTPLASVTIRKNTTNTQMFNVGNSFTNIGTNGTYSTETNIANIVNRNISSNAVAFSSSVVGFTFNTTGYLAFTFIGQSLSSQAAWAEITFSNDGSNGGFTISKWGYETLPLPSNTIDVLEGSPVPEPSTYALGLGVIALGVAMIRRRRS